MEKDQANNKKRAPRILIVGGGFGGLEAAKGLTGADADVLLIDARNHHCFQPLLDQAATAALSAADIAWPIRRVMRGQKNVTVLMAEAESVDIARQVVLTSQGELAFDWLVLATGAAHSYFGHENWAQQAPGLKTIDDALRIRSLILRAFERAEAATLEEERRRLLTFVVIGGGPTGVELAGAIAELAHKTLPPEFRRADPRRARILLLEAGPRLLPVFPPRLSDYARRELEVKGVDVRTETKVEDLAKGFVLAGGERIEADGAILWAAGVRASPVADWLGAAADRNGRVIVQPDLSVPGAQNIFVIGDAAAAVGADGLPAPGSRRRRNKWAATSPGRCARVWLEKPSIARFVIATKARWRRSAATPRS